jgi:hypothetical protein
MIIFYLAASLFWCTIVVISVCSHSVPSEGFNSLPETQGNTYLYNFPTLRNHLVRSIKSSIRLSPIRDFIIE